jgi:hypothetical protein
MLIAAVALRIIPNRYSDLLDASPRVVNVGLESLAEAVVASGAAVIQLDWSPPARGADAADAALARLANHPLVEEANRVALARMLGCAPVLRATAPARDALHLGERTLLHAGPPIEWQRMCGPMQGAVIGALLYEGWAHDPRAARALAERGEIEFAPCHDRGAVGPMAGIISPSMPVWIVEDAALGRRAFSNFNEGLGKALRFGAYGPEVLERLKWIESTLAPALGAALTAAGGIELKPLIAQALHMGDEAHNRNAAASGLLLRRLAGALARLEPRVDARVLDFLAANDHFFLNISMAACKLMLDAAHGVRGSSLVTAMARNGVDFGVRVSGLGARWFTAPAPAVSGLFFAGYGDADAANDLGDSAITETAGLGAFAMAAAPAIVKFVGGGAADALAHSRAMRHIALGESDAFQIPALEFRGTAAGIDARKVVDTGLEPVINTGIAHREPGIGQIGAGLTRAPLECFVGAVRALDEELHGQGGKK